MFVLSPAHTGGVRGSRLLRGASASAVALDLHGAAGARLGDVFTSISQLYFRGKWRYAERFAHPPAGECGVLVIVPGSGLVDVDARISHDDLVRMASVPIDPQDTRYTEPLERDARRLARRLAGIDRVVFLGSVATDKYIHVLHDVLGDRLLVPATFAGLGSMSRGSILLKSVETGRQLLYTPVEA